MAVITLKEPRRERGSAFVATLIVSALLLGLVMAAGRNTSRLAHLVRARQASLLEVQKREREAAQVLTENPLTVYPLVGNGPPIAQLRSTMEALPYILRYARRAPDLPRHPDWKLIIGAVHAPMMCSLASNSNGVGSSNFECSNDTLLINSQVAVQGNLDSETVTISPTTSAMAVGVLGEVRIRSLIVEAEMPAQVEILATGEIAIGTIELRGVGTRLHIHSSWGAITLGAVPPANACRATLSLSANRGLTVGEQKIEGPVTACTPFTPTTPYWPEKAIIGESS